MKLQDRATFYQKLHTAMAAGLTLEQALGAELLPAGLAGHAWRLRQEMANGTAIATAFTRTGLVSPWEAELIHVGESSGRLQAVLARLETFFTTKARRLGQVRARLVYPLLLVLAAILLLPLPSLASGALSLPAYGLGVAAKLGVLYAAYKLIIARAFTTAAHAAFNPFLARLLRRVGSGHFLRLQYDVAYLDLLTLCLDSGMDAVQSLQLMQRCRKDRDFQRRHALAVSAVAKEGKGLATVLSVNGILANPQVLSYLVTSEASGTLHSDLRTFVAKKKEEVDTTVAYWVNRIGTLLYAAAIIYAVVNILP